MAHNGALAAGTRVGRYEVQSLLGTGGMGEVYVARDTALGRRVALKILPSDCDPQRVARFVREAQASSALSHPAIVSVHDAGSADGIYFLAMELIDGEPMSMWLRSRRNIRRGIEYLAQVADALASAHAAGIIHRDLKPANIMIGRDGYAKIVDFGIAKLTERVTDSDADAATDLKTASGSITGTTAYMSPEQADGREVDFRSDIFSFGTVLYELLTGRNPFAGSTRVDTLHNIARLDPPLEPIPSAFRRVVRRCLAREKEERYESARDIGHDLRDTLIEPEPEAPQRRFTPWQIIAAIFVIALIAILTWMVRPWRGHQGVATGSAQTMQPLTNAGNVWSATVSPDGKFVVYSAFTGSEGTGLWVMQVATGTASKTSTPSLRGFPVIRISPDSAYIYTFVALPPAGPAIYRMPLVGGEMRPVVANLNTDASQFTLSPDGRQLAFIRYGNGQTTLFAADAEGGNERPLLRRTRPFGIPAWSPDGKSIAFVANGHIEELLLAAGQVTGVASAPWRLIRDMQWHPDGSGLLVCASKDDEPPQVWLLHRNAGAPVRITSDLGAYYSATPTADGQAFVALRGEGSPTISILAVTASGPRIVTSGLGRHFAFSGARSKGTTMTHGETVRWLDAEHILYSGLIAGRQALFVVSRSGGEPVPLLRGMSAVAPAIAPDGKRIAFLSDRSGTYQVWTCGPDGRDTNQLTHGDPAEWVDFSSDGRFVYYWIPSHNRIWRIPASGGEPQDVAIETSWPMDLSRDGRWLMAQGRPPYEKNVFLFPLAGGAPRIFGVLRNFTRSGLRFHPSSRAFTFSDWSQETAVPNLWMQDIDGGPPRQITAFDRGDIYAFDWSRDGKSLAMMQGNPAIDVVMVRNFR
ncbi:MAG: eukaryotic-like serine/threonine-protein kinase [Thermoanaerobaculia bacterium]|jgi:serine/threonine protein kinase|nr:eukaryotic-like serine/threonine-protein kinase [Thermoanaerobaculia bacterium]